MLVGRAAERARFRAVLDGPRVDKPGPWSCWEPGIRKAALLEDLVAGATAEGVRVLTT